MDPDLTILALCAGGGGLERAVRLVVPGARVVCMVEREAFCAESLAHQVETLGVGPAALWPDLETFDGRPWCGVVDLLTAGIPCQPHSVAGKRLGAADARNLWPAAERVIRQVEPGFVFLENVSGSVAFFGEHVVGGLERLGYDVEAGLFEAAEVGASHKRVRLFVLGHREGGRRQRREVSVRPPRQEQAAPRPAGSGPGMAHALDLRAGYGVEGVEGDPAGHRRHRFADGSAAVADHAESRCAGRGLPVRRPQQQGQTEANPVRACPGVADAECANRRARPQGTSPGTAQAEPGVERGRPRLADAEPPRPQGDGLALTPRRGEPEPCDPDGPVLPLFPPGPADLDAWADVLTIDPTLEPALCGASDGLAARADRLRMLGNGVVPLQAAYAFCTLLARLERRLR